MIEKEIIQLHCFRNHAKTHSRATNWNNIKQTKTKIACIVYWLTDFFTNVILSIYNINLFVLKSSKLLF